MRIIGITAALGGIAAFVALAIITDDSTVRVLGVVGALFQVVALVSHVRKWQGDRRGAS